MLAPFLQQCFLKLTAAYTISKVICIRDRTNSVHLSTSSDEDIKLNSQVFHWPENIKAVFELSQNRITSKREHIEDELRSRTKAFEDRLNDMMKDVESFKKKEVGFSL